MKSVLSLALPWQTSLSVIWLLSRGLAWYDAFIHFLRQPVNPDTCFCNCNCSYIAETARIYPFCLSYDPTSDIRFLYRNDVWIWCLAVYWQKYKYILRCSSSWCLDLSKTRTKGLITAEDGYRETNWIWYKGMPAKMLLRDRHVLMQFNCHTVSMV